MKYYPQNHRDYFISHEIIRILIFFYQPRIFNGSCQPGQLFPESETLETLETLQNQWLFLVPLKGGR